MQLTKLLTMVPGKYDYVNVEYIECVYEDDDHYDVHMVDGTVLCIALTETKISTLLANAA
jgi:hypothetical protein